MKYLLSLGLVVLLSNPIESFAQDPLYPKAEFQKILETYDEIVVNMDGWEYKYSGNWTNTMSIDHDHALTFTRGKVTHSYDLSKVVFVQEEGNYVKLRIK